MHYTSGLIAAVMATAAMAAAAPKCGNGGYFAGGFDHDTCFVVRCNQEITTGTPFKHVRGTDIYDCSDKCWVDGDCISVDFDKATKKCTFYDNSLVKHSRNPGFDRATFSEFTDGPCIGA